MRNPEPQLTWWEKVKNSFSFVDPADEYDDRYDPLLRAEEGELLPFPTGTKSQIALSTPTNFDDVKMPADYLKSGRAVLLNFHRLDKKTSDSARFLLTGIAYAVDGSAQKITETIYMFTPNEVGLIYADEQVDKETETEEQSRFQKRLFG